MDAWGFSMGVILGFLLGYGFKFWTIGAIVRLGNHIHHLVDIAEKYMDYSLELELEVNRLREKCKDLEDPSNPKNKQFHVDKAVEKIKKRIREVDQDLPPVLPDVRGGLLDPSLDQLPKIGNHKVHAPRVFTLKLKLRSLKRLWKDLLK